MIENNTNIDFLKNESFDLNKSYITNNQSKTLAFQNCKFDKTYYEITLTEEVNFYF
jgi:hypothetical protein